jgi:hypothetical protein
VPPSAWPAVAAAIVTVFVIRSSSLGDLASNHRAAARAERNLLSLYWPVEPTQEKSDADATLDDLRERDRRRRAAAAARSRVLGHRRREFPGSGAVRSAVGAAAGPAGSDWRRAAAPGAAPAPGEERLGRADARGARLRATQRNGAATKWERAETEMVARRVFFLQWTGTDPTVKQILSPAKKFFAVTATRP